LYGKVVGWWAYMRYMYLSEESAHLWVCCYGVGAADSSVVKREKNKTTLPGPGRQTVPEIHVRPCAGNQDLDQTSARPTNLTHPRVVLIALEGDCSFELISSLVSTTLFSH